MMIRHGRRSHGSKAIPSGGQVRPGFYLMLDHDKKRQSHAIWMKRHRMGGKHTDGLCEADCRSGKEQRNERIYNT
jgi:hypothetical protein